MSGELIKVLLHALPILILIATLAEGTITVDILRTGRLRQRKVPKATEPRLQPRQLL